MPNIIYGFFIMIEMLVSALLIAIILLQKSKGGMGGSAFGGGMGEAIFGSRMGNVLTKATVILSIIFIVNTVWLTALTARQSRPSGSGSVTDGQIPTAQPAPIGGIAPVAAPVPSTDVPPTSGPVPIELPPMEVDVDAVAPIEIPAPVAVEVPVAEPTPVVPVTPAPEAIPLK